MHKRRVLFAAAGTGGHLFPAQTLAAQLLEKNPEMELIFAGAGLSKNAYFDKEKYPFQDISSETPFRRSIIKSLKSIFILIKGIVQSLKLLDEKKIELVVGFGSFHTFPLLCAAVLKKIPLVLYESNSIPGKVVRLFSKKAMLNAVNFSEAKRHLEGNIVEVEMPMKKGEVLSQEEARRLFNLKNDLFTVLVFGGSQGAKKINQSIIELLPLLHREQRSLQLIHFTGSDEGAKEVELACEKWGVTCYVKKFEKQMHIAWSAADLVICRSGAMTLSELMYYEVPGILVPYPFAADQHQLKNAQFFEKSVGGAQHIADNHLTAESLLQALRKNTSSMKQAMKDFKAKQTKKELSHLITDILKQL